MDDIKNPKKDEDLIVGYSDYYQNRRVYSPAIPRFTLWGALLGAMLLGTVSWLVAAGIWPIANFGQFSAAGDGVAAVTGTSVGAALGGLSGGLIALYRLYHNQDISPVK